MLPADLGPLCLQQLPWLLEAHTPMQVGPRASTALWAPDNSSPPALQPHRNPQLATQCQEPATTHSSEPQAPGSAIFSLQETSLPKSMEAQLSPPSLTAKEPVRLPRQRARTPDPHWGEESYNLPLCRQHQKPWSPKVHWRPALHAAPPCRRVTSLLSKHWNPDSFTEW
jgi:hypothetical protein